MEAINLSKATVNLSKNQVINLSKTSEGLSKIMIGLGWDPVDKSTQQYREVSRVVKPGFIGRLFGAQERTVVDRIPVNSNVDDIDLDAWVQLLEGEGSGARLNSTHDIVYYGQLKYYNNEGDLVIRHYGDDLTGASAATNKDCEQISIDLDKVPAKFSEILISVTIYKGWERNQTFDIVKNNFIRVVDTRDNFEMCRFNQADMSESQGAYTFVAGRLYKEKNEWQFEAIGKCTKHKSIQDLANEYMRGNPVA